jgi:hypothetical protein
MDLLICLEESILFIRANNGVWIPIQVKTTAMEPTYLISRMGCKAYIIADKKGKKFEIDVIPRPDFLPQ